MELIFSLKKINTMEKVKKNQYYLFVYKYVSDTTNLYYRFICASGKKDAKHKFIMSIVQPISYYDFRRTNNLPLLMDGEILESTID